MKFILNPILTFIAYFIGYVIGIIYTILYLIWHPKGMVEEKKEYIKRYCQNGWKQAVKDIDFWCPILLVNHSNP